MEAGTYNLETTITGDTFNQVSFAVAPNGSPLNLTGYTIKLQIRNTYTSTAVKSLEIGSGITVTNAAGGVFRIDAFVVDFAAGTYVYDIQLTSSGGVVKTYIAGEMVILNDVTR